MDGPYPTRVVLDGDQVERLLDALDRIGNMLERIAVTFDEAMQPEIIEGEPAVDHPQNGDQAPVGERTL